MKNLKNIVLINEPEDETTAFKKNQNESHRKNYSKREHKETFGSCIDYKRQKTGLQCKRGGGFRGVVRTMRANEELLIKEELGL